MKKYYIEIADANNFGEFIMQSEWFDTEEKAIEWANNVTFLQCEYEIYLMSSEWDITKDIYTDIKCVRNIKKELNL